MYWRKNLWIVLLVVVLSSYAVKAQSFIVDGLTYEVTGTDPNTVTLRSGNNATGDIVIPETVTFDSTVFSVTQIRFDAFRDDQITSVVIPASVTNIGNNAFRNTSLTVVISNNTTAPSLGDNIFLDTPDNIALTVQEGSEASYTSADWNRYFFSINGIPRIGARFQNNGFQYEVTSTNPNTVILRTGNNATGDIVIPETVTVNTNTFSVTQIRVSAFEGDQITSVVIPASVTNIGNSAFRNTALTAVISNNTTAPSLGNNIFLDTPFTIALTIPEDSAASYEQAGWNRYFFFINGMPRIGARFQNNGFEYEVTGTNPNTVMLRNGNNATGDIVIPETVTVNTNTFSVTQIRVLAFGDDQITSVVIPASVTNIGNSAFKNTALTTVISNNTTAPSIEVDAFAATPNTITLTVPEGSESSYEQAGWGRYFLTINGELSVGFEFESDGLIYTVTSVNPNAIKYTREIGNPSNVIVPDNIILDRFTLPVTRIGRSSSRNNPNLELVKIGKNVTSIAFDAFQGSSVSKVIYLSANPAPIVFGVNNLMFTSIDNHSQIDLYIPIGATQTFIDAGWINFRSYIETTGDMLLSPKVFLQGAGVNPNIGEEELMRDDLRVSSNFPPISPYEDALTVRDTFSLFSKVGQKAIIDWVLVQLRDASNANEIITSRSAILLRDGSVVDVDGESPVLMSAFPGDYFITIQHRNHLGIRSANPVALSNSAVNTIDFTSDVSLLQGGQNAVVTLANGKLAMVAGDADENGNIQISDLNALISELGKSGYSIFDLNMNGQIQINDINGLLTPNLGRGEQ
jgi:hypothetical protein